MSAAGAIPPPVSWAQRNDLIYVIIDVECKDIEHKVTEKSFTFKGVNALDASKKYEVTLNFYGSVEPDSVTSKNIGRCLEFTIPKKSSGPYWPCLTTDKTKLHFLKANFAKWRDESDDEEAGGQEGKDNNMFGNIMNYGSDWNNKFDDFNLDEDDDSDDNIPSLSQNDEDEEEGGEANKAGEGKKAGDADKAGDGGEGDKEKKPAA